MKQKVFHKFLFPCRTPQAVFCGEKRNIRVYPTMFEMPDIKRNEAFQANMSLLLAREHRLKILTSFCTFYRSRLDHISRFPKETQRRSSFSSNFFTSLGTFFAQMKLLRALSSLLFWYFLFWFGTCGNQLEASDFNSEPAFHVFRVQ